MSRQRTRRRGLSLIELLVASGCVLVLISLTAPAVNSARNTAARANCKNNLRQIGLALHNYHDVHGCFPPGWVSKTALPNSGPRYGWQTMILPFVEEMPIYRLLDFHKPMPAARGILQRSINVYRCPSDPTPGTNALRGDYGTSNYSGNYGTVAIHWLSPRRAQFWPGQMSSPKPSRQTTNGLFYRNSNMRFRHIVDGTSNTFLVGERSARSGAGIWAGVGSNNLLNDAVTDCSAGNAPNSGYSAFSSYHVGGANFLLCDGGVKFISDKINVRAYRNLSNRSDGEVVRGF